MPELQTDTKKMKNKNSQVQDKSAGIQTIQKKKRLIDYAITKIE